MPRPRKIKFPCHGQSSPATSPPHAAPHVTRSRHSPLRLWYAEGWHLFLAETHRVPTAAPGPKKAKQKFNVRLKGRGKWREFNLGRAHGMSHASHGPNRSCREPAASPSPWHCVAGRRGHVGGEGKEGNVGPHLRHVLGLPAAPCWLRTPQCCPHQSLGPGCRLCPLGYGGRWGLVNGKICLRKESPKIQTRAWREALGCSFTCLTKRAVYNTENSHTHKGFGDFRESHPKTPSQTRAFLARCRLEVQAFSRVRHSLIPG